MTAKFVSPIPSPKRVFLSHTNELAEFPQPRSFVDAAKAAVARAGHAVCVKEYFSARDQTPRSYCTEKVQQCDVYIGLIGLRYGSRVDGEEDLSYTELEFAVASGETEQGTKIPRLVFVQLAERTAVMRPSIDRYFSESTPSQAVISSMSPSYLFARSSSWLGKSIP